MASKKELERRIKELEKSYGNVVTCKATGALVERKNTVAKPVLRKIRIFDWFLDGSIVQFDVRVEQNHGRFNWDYSKPSMFWYFTIGKEPACDYIILDENDVPHYMKFQPDQEIDERGNLISPKVAKKKK